MVRIGRYGRSLSVWVRHGILQVGSALVELYLPGTVGLASEWWGRFHLCLIVSRLRCILSNCLLLLLLGRCIHLLAVSLLFGALFVSGHLNKIIQPKQVDTTSSAHQLMECKPHIEKSQAYCNQKA